MRIVVPVVVVVLAICAIVWKGYEPGDAVGVTTDPPKAVTEDAAPPVQQASSAVKPLDPSQLNPVEGAAIRLPDGSKVPVLNGAVGAKPPSWPRDYPYSKLVGVQSDAQSGLDWYVHEDGSKWTTRMVWRKDLNRYDPSTSLYNPTTPSAPNASIDTPPSER